MNQEFKELCTDCPRLKILLEEQQESGLPKDKWLAVMRLFIDAGRIALARKFSEQSEKHDYESDEVIDTLSLQRRDRRVRCTELGCTKKDIEVSSKENAGCCGGEKAKTNEEGEITNSPYSKMRLTNEEKERIGFYYNDEKDEDRYTGMNPNRYARHILKNYNLMYHESDRYYIYRGNCWKPLGDFRMKKVLRAFFNKFEPDRWTTAIQNTYMSALCYECWDIEDLKSAENYINVKNGLLDLSSENMYLTRHDSMVFSTTQISIQYDSEEKCKKFKEFLSATFQGNKKLIMLVQEIMGYCLSNSVKAHKMFIFVGEGSNGKSVLCEIMTALAGGIENVSSVSLKDFGHKFSLSQIADKTLNISTENEMDTNLDTQLLKAITSGEAVQMEEKFQKPFSYKPYVKLVFAMNSLPYARDKSYGFERRLVVIPFEMRFVNYKPRLDNEAERDPYLTERLIKNELPGILAFAIRGLKRLRKNGYVFTYSKKAQQALEEYKEKMDPMLEFVRNYIKENMEAEKVSTTALRSHFQGWCEREGHDRFSKISSQTFWTQLKRVLENEGIYYEQVKANKRYIKGIKVKGLNDEPKKRRNDKMTYWQNELADL
jgi:putative DNA primase/helicase